MNWKDTQLKWYGGDYIQQDYDLEQFIIANRIRNIKYLGKSEHVKVMFGREKKPANMVIWLVNYKFQFSQIVKECNSELENLGPGGILYLSLNKFLATPEPQENIDTDYNLAIFDFMKNNVNYPILKYHSGAQDYGNKFNWAHPLTRFYFYHENFSQDTKYH
jgi:hypothetical protein